MSGSDDLPNVCYAEWQEAGTVTPQRWEYSRTTTLSVGQQLELQLTSWVKKGCIHGHDRKSYTNDGHEVFRSMTLDGLTYWALGGEFKGMAKY